MGDSGKISIIEVIAKNNTKGKLETTIKTYYNNLNYYNYYLKIFVANGDPLKYGEEKCVISPALGVTL